MITNPSRKTPGENLRGLACRYYIGTILFSLMNINSLQAAGMPKVEDFQEKPKGRHLVVRYHPNGKIREKGYQGHYADKSISTGTFVGTWYYYDQKGKLLRSFFYHNDTPSKAYIQKKTFYPNGRLRSVEIFNNYELYESEKDSIGKWKYFDRTGKLIKVIIH